MKNSQKSLRLSVVIVCLIAVVAALMFMRLLPVKSMSQNAPVANAKVPATIPNSFPVVQTKLFSPRPRSKPLLDTAAVIARLRAWQAENDPEAKAELELELEALLTDANAADILRALPPDLIATPFAEAALRRWASVDRGSAATWMATQSGLTEQEQTAVIYGWNAEDKKGLEDYLDALSAGEWKQNAMKFAANDALAGGSPKDAIDLLAKMDRTPTRDDLMKWSATAWAQSNSAAALQWANNLQDADQQQKALGAVAVGLAWSNPQAAGELLAQSVKPGEVLDKSALSVVCVWSQSDPQAAANWVAEFPEGNLQQTVLETLIQRWVTQDAATATSWVNALPDGPLHQKAAEFLTAATANLQKEETVQQTSLQ